MWGWVALTVLSLGLTLLYFCTWRPGRSILGGTCAVLLFFSIFCWANFTSHLNRYNSKLPALCLNGRHLGENTSSLYLTVNDKRTSSWSHTVTKQCFIPIAVYPCYDGAGVDPSRWQGDCFRLSSSPLAQWPEYVLETDVSCSQAAMTWGSSQGGGSSCNEKNWKCRSGGCTADEATMEKCMAKINTSPYGCYYNPAEIESFKQDKVDDANVDDEADDWFPRHDDEDLDVISRNGVYEVADWFPAGWLCGGLISAVLLLTFCSGGVAVALTEGPIGKQFVRYLFVLTLGQAAWLVILSIISGSSGPLPESHLPVERSYSWQFGIRNTGVVKDAPPVGQSLIFVVLLVSGSVLGALVCMASCVLAVLRIENYSYNLRSRAPDPERRPEAFDEKVEEATLGWGDTVGEPDRKPELVWFDIVALAIVVEVEASHFFLRQLGQMLGAARGTQPQMLDDEWVGSDDLSVPAQLGPLAGTWKPGGERVTPADGLLLGEEDDAEDEEENHKAEKGARVAEFRCNASALSEPPMEEIAAIANASADGSLVTKLEWQAEATVQASRNPANGVLVGGHRAGLDGSGTAGREEHGGAEASCIGAATQEVDIVRAAGRHLNEGAEARSIGAAAQEVDDEKCGGHTSIDDKLPKSPTGLGLQLDISPQSPAAASRAPAMVAAPSTEGINETRSSVHPLVDAFPSIPPPPPFMSIDLTQRDRSTPPLGSPTTPTLRPREAFPSEGGHVSVEGAAERDTETAKDLALPEPCKSPSITSAADKLE